MGLPHLGAPLLGDISTARRQHLLLPAKPASLGSTAPRALHQMRLRPPRHPRPLPGMRRDSCQGKRMKRLRRITFNALTALSLVLCLATVGVWVRSYWIVD